jgi:hypothetical protein
MFPTVAAVRREGLHPQITRRRMAIRMLHPGDILVRAPRPAITPDVSAACIVFYALMHFFKMQYRQVALSRIRPDAMHPCPKIKVSRVLRRRRTIIAYACALCSAMTNTYRQQGFTMPTPPDALVAVLEIIHAVFLTNKKTQHG